MTTPTQAQEREATCQCAACRPISYAGLSSVRMILCATCGNKRCPHATNHIFACTGSNEADQHGSAYGVPYVPAPASGEAATPIEINSLEELNEAKDHCFYASEMDLRHQGKALRDFALPALEYAALALTVYDIAKANPAPAPGMAVQALAGEIVEALLLDEKDGGYDLTAGMFGKAFSDLVRRWAAAEMAMQALAKAKPAAGAEPVAWLGNHRMTTAFKHIADAWASNGVDVKPLCHQPDPSERDAHRGDNSYEASMLRNLLARIHGDGGHHLEAHGLDKSLEDADVLIANWRSNERDAEDTARLDWLESMTVNVRQHLRYGSTNVFWAGPEEGDGEILPSDLRQKIDAQREQSEKRNKEHGA
jgi:hypothetical protein